MQSCVGAKAWKSVQVLAGSIVESLLIDYLASTTRPGRPGKDPLRLDLAEAIALCRAENAISERTSDLCSVIRSYRNLIHPGRAVRLAEPAPSAKSAQIAAAVVDLIVGDIADARRASLGLTAEQIVSKIRRDENSLAILQHLLKGAPPLQHERLLLELIPAAYRSLLPPGEEWEQAELDRLEKAYRIVFDGVPEDIRRKATSEFVRVLREEDGSQVSIHREAFFRPADLKYVAPSEAAMVRQHLLSLVPSRHDARTLRFADGVAPYLDPSEVLTWLDPFVRTLISTAVSEPVKAKVKSHLLSATMETSRDFDEAISARLDDWIRHYKTSSSGDAALIENLKEEIESERIPF